MIGCGYVGLTTAVCLASSGHQVVAVDNNLERIDMLSRGQCTILESELPELLEKCLKNENLKFAVSGTIEFDDIEYLFICLPTPQLDDGSADLSVVFEVLDSLVNLIPRDCVLVMKSTVPIGTGSKILSIYGEVVTSYVSNPEFLREGSAVADYFSPDRIVIGSNRRDCAVQVSLLYSKIQAPIIITDIESAEAIKYASNAFLAIKISFINEIASLCEVSGANIDNVVDGIGSDKRIGKSFLAPGPGWGGSCFPKDTNALVAATRQFGLKAEVVESAISANRSHQRRIIDRITAQFPLGLDGVLVGVLGLTFKAGTDDIRESPAVAIAEALRKLGAIVKAFDPALSAKADSVVWDDFRRSENVHDAVNGTSLIVVLTEWPEFGKIEPSEIVSTIGYPLVFDTRSILDRARWQEAGFTFLSVGHP